MENELENTLETVEQENVISENQEIVVADSQELLIPDNQEIMIAEKPKNVIAVKSEPAEVPVKKSNRRILTGKVTSNKMDKSIVVAVVRQVAHPIYKKYYKRTNRFMAHDENNECKIGDTVKVRESRPLSAKKRWELIEIIDRAK
jgi:small subunit ribosomal protein S17